MGKNDRVKFYIFVRSSSASTMWPTTTTGPSTSFSGDPVCGEDGATSKTVYMYRAQSDAQYSMENVNVADLPGVLWYLHNEVVKECPRKNEITRILRLKVTFREYVAYVAFDNGRCTVPGISANRIQFPGCQPRDYAGVPGTWYSLPGRCPLQPIGQKYEGCESQLGNPGGNCGCDRKLGENGCSYHYEYAGEINLDELVGYGGREGYLQYCQAGGLEYDPWMDSGRNNDFWQGFNDYYKAQWRIDAVKNAFAEKYPNSPTELEPSPCAR